MTCGSEGRSQALGMVPQIGAQFQPHTKSGFQGRQQPENEGYAKDALKGMIK